MKKRASSELLEEKQSKLPKTDTVVNTAIDEESSEEEWEAVEQQTPISSIENTEGQSRETNEDIQISLDIKEPTETLTKAKGKPRQKITKEDRLVRFELHRAHLLFLFASSRIRNSWCNDESLKSMCYNILPSELKTELLTVNQASLDSLHAFWSNYFKTESRNTNFNQTSVVEEIAKVLSCSESHEYTISHECSVLALVSALRSIGLNARLVSSLYPVTLSFSESKQKLPFYFWCEVFSHEAKKWLSIDPNAKLNASLPTRNDYSYIIVLEKVFGTKDVTRKYATEFNSKTIKLRMPDTNDGERWWQGLLWLYSKSDIEECDTLEETLLENDIDQQTMPKNLAGFNNHPFYALEKQCKKNEVIYPNTLKDSIGTYNKLLVFPRKNVMQMLSPENWLKQGLTIKENEEPFKTVKASSHSIGKKREDEALKEDGGEGRMARLYGKWQTEPFVPPAIVDGYIPRNSFGNFELFHSHMLPSGAVHIKLSGLGRIAKRLGINYAEAVTGFKFGQRVVPVIEGIVVACASEEVLVLAHHEDMVQKQENYQKKLEKLVIGRWKMLVSKAMQKRDLFEKYMPAE